MQEEFTLELAERGAEMCGAFGLRAYDACHLAAAEHLQRDGRDKLIFTCLGRRLSQVAAMLGLSLAEGV